MEINIDQLTQLINEAADCLDARDPVRAKTLSLQAIEIYPDSEQAWANLAFAEIQLGNGKEAENAAREAISINPHHATAWHNLGEANILLGNGEEALKYHNRAISLDPTKAVFYLGQAEAYMQLEQYENAIRSFDISLLLDPENQSAKLNREVAILLGDEIKSKILKSMIGLSAMIDDGEKNIKEAFKVLQGLVYGHQEIFNSKLIESLDCFSIINIRMKKDFAKSFCLLNRMLALILVDEKMIARCTLREEEARKQFS